MGRAIQTPLALQDIDEAAEYIADDDITAAICWLERVEEVYQMLADSPLAGRPRPELGSDMRSYPCVSHVIFYRPIGDGVEILRVLHGSRDYTELLT